MSPRPVEMGSPVERVTTIPTMMVYDKRVTSMLLGRARRRTDRKMVSRSGGRLNRCADNVT